MVTCGTLCGGKSGSPRGQGLEAVSRVTGEKVSFYFYQQHLKNKKRTTHLCGAFPPAFISQYKLERVPTFEPATCGGHSSILDKYSTFYLRSRE